MGYQDSGNRSCAFHSGNLNSNTVNVKNNMLILHAATFPCLYQNNVVPFLDSAIAPMVEVSYAEEVSVPPPPIQTLFSISIGRA